MHVRKNIYCVTCFSPMCCYASLAAAAAVKGNGRNTNLENKEEKRKHSSDISMSPGSKNRRGKKYFFSTLQKCKANTAAAGPLLDEQALGCFLTKIFLLSDENVFALSIDENGLKPCFLTKFLNSNILQFI